METKKIFGILLIVCGVAIIGYALFESYGIFSGIKEPPHIFSNAGPVAEHATSLERSGIQEQAQQIATQELQKLIPLGSVEKTLNLAAWSMFVGLLLFGGGQIAGIGVKLLKA